MFKTILCSIFDHQFGEWEYISEDSCEMVRVCKRDGFKQNRTAPHEFGEWEYASEDTCEMVRICKRDGFKQNRTVPHAFGEWEYISEDTCETVRICKRDGFKQKGTRHEFGEVVDCEVTCARCGYKMESHDWEITSTEQELVGAVYEKDGAYRDVWEEVSHYTCKRCYAEK